MTVNSSNCLEKIVVDILGEPYYVRERPVSPFKKGAGSPKKNTMDEKRHVPRSLFTFNIAVSVSVKVIVKVKHCVNGE